MNESAVVRLLFEGLPPIGEQAPTALPFSPAELAASPLALPESALLPTDEGEAAETKADERTQKNVEAESADDENAQAPRACTRRKTGRPAPADTESSALSGWRPREQNGVRWLARPVPGLPGPVYITGAATSSLDAARLLVEADLFPEWASVLVLSQSAGRGQMRRAWSSPAGNLYTALRLPMAPPFDS